MINATAYIVNQQGVITDQNGTILHTMPGFKAACGYV